MANSLYKVHELMVKAGVELEEPERKRIESIAEKAGDLLSRGMVKAAGASFEEIGEILNKKLREVGKDEIVFSNFTIDEHTLDNMVSAFTSKLSKGIVDGVKDGFKKAKGAASTIDLGVDDQITKLKAQRKELLAEYNEFKKTAKVKNKTQIDKLNAFSIGDAKTFKIDDDIFKKADEITTELKDAINKIETFKKGTSEYTSAVLDAQKKYNEYLIMQKTLKEASNKPGNEGWNFRHKTPTEIKARYDLWRGDDRENYEDAGGKLRPFAESSFYDVLDKAFNSLVQTVEDVDAEMREYESKLKKLEDEIVSLGGQYESDKEMKAPKKRGRPKKTDADVSKVVQNDVSSVTELANAEKDIANTTQNSLDAAEEKLKVEKEILDTKKAEVKTERLLSKLSSTSNLDKEKFAYLNTDTGHISQHIEGEYGTISKNAQRALFEQLMESVNATLHTHPEFVAAPSEDDIMNFAKNHALFKKNFILAGEQLAEVDFTSLSDTQAMELAEKYKKNILSAENELDNRFNQTQFSDLGVESLDIPGILSKASDQLKARFPDLQADIDEFINKLGSMFDGVKVGDLTQDNLENIISGAMGSIVKDKGSDFATDGFQLVVDTFNGASGIPSMYQEALLDIFKKTITSLDLDPSQIFKLHNVNDFESKLVAIRQQSTDAYKANIAAVNESTAAHKNNSDSVPLEDEIKSGSAVWRCMPIKYDPSLDHEAENKTDYMKVGDKFFEAKNQDNILDHEVAHNIADRLMKYAANTWGKATDIFMSNGEGLYGDLGASAMSETLAHAVTEYFSDPDALKARSGDAFNYIEEYLKKSGDTLDNVYSKRGEVFVKSEPDTVVADNEQKIKSYEELKVALQEYRNAVINAKNAEDLEQKQPHVEKFMDLNNLLLGQLEDGNNKSQLFAKLKDIANIEVDEGFVGSIAQMFGIAIPKAATSAKQSVDDLNESLQKQNQIEQSDNASEEIAEEQAKTNAINERTQALLGLINQIADSQIVSHDTAVIDFSLGVADNENVRTDSGLTELRDVLDDITFKVKIVHDDNDKTANKITLDDSTLETALKKVLSDINKPTEQNDGVAKGDAGPWALEKTLNTTIKNVLDNIHTQVKGINGKIVEGTKVLRVSSNKKTEEKSTDLEIKNPKELGNVKATMVPKEVKALEAEYKRLGELQGYDDSVKRVAAQQLEDSLKITVERLEKEGVINDTIKQRLESLRLEAKSNQENIERAKKLKQEYQIDVREERKMARKEEGVAAANTAWNAGKRALGNTWKFVGLTDKEIEKIPQVQELTSVINDLGKKQSEINLKIAKHQEILPEEVKELNKYTDAAKKHTLALNELVKNYEFFSGDNAESLGQKYAGGDLQQQLKQAITLATNGKAKFGEYDPVLKQWTYTVRGAGNIVEHFVGGLRDTDQELMRVHTRTKKTESMFEAIQRKVKEVFTYFSGSSIIYKIFGWIRQGIQYVREIDSALTELKKVTDETEETYDKFLDTAAKTANRLGSTIVGVTEATATFVKLGYSMEMASEMAEAALVYKNVGDGIASAEDAADSIISTLKGFGLEASEAMRIVDRFNEVGNKFAITTKGIGEALRVSASALSTAGNTLDESIGLITAANEVVNDPSSVGTALKTLTLRLRGAKTELEEAGLDIENMATTTSQLQSKLLALTGGKVDIMLDAQTFKSSTQILREMAAAWETMTDVQQAAALELMGGKRQANILAALITNFDTVESVIEASENSAGSALRENEEVLDSFEGRLQQLTNTVQTKWSEALDTDVIKDAISLFTKLIDTLDFEDNAIIRIFDELVKVLSTLIDLFGGNAGLTLISFLGAKMIQDRGWFSFLDNVKKKGEETIEGLTESIIEFKKQEDALANKATKQSGKPKEKTIQELNDTKTLRENAERKLKELEGNKQAEIDAMKFSEKEQKEIVESMDIDHLKRQIAGKKSAKSKRAKQLQDKGKTFAQIESDPKIQQYNKEIKEGQEALDQYNQNVQNVDASLNKVDATIAQASGTTATNTGAQNVNTSSQNANAIARQNAGAQTDAHTQDINENTGATEVNTNAQNKNSQTLKNGANGLKSFGQQILKTVTYMAIIQGAMQVLDGIVAGVSWALNTIFPKAKTFEELHKEFEVAADDLQQEKSELSNVENELDDIKSQIQDIEALGTLSFTNEEELKRLQKQREELERQAEIQEIITKNQQKKTNDAALRAAQSYMIQSAETDKTLDEAAEKSKETGKQIGSFVDGLLMIGGAVLTVATGWTGGGAIAGGAMMAAGLAGVMQNVGGAIGKGSGEAEYKKQQTHQQAVNSYESKKENYQKRLDDAFAKGNANEYEKIKKEYDNFEVMMADNIGGLIEYLNSVDYKTLSDTQKKQFETLQRIVNQYSLANDGSIVNVIDSILNYDRYEKTGYAMDRVQKKLKTGDISEDEAKVQIEQLLSESPQLITEFTDLGIKIEDVVAAYVRFGAATRDNASAMDSLGKVSAVTNAFDDLGAAIKEFREEGVVSIGTLEGLNETFGNVDGFEELYTVLATGEGDLESAVTNVANAYVGQVGVLSDMTDEEIAIMVSRLKSIGVLNAEEVLMARQKGQAQLDALGLAYSIDLSNYGTAEQAKLAIAQAAGLNIANIADNQVEKLAEQYGLDLKNYATTEEAKIAIAQERAKAEAESEKLVLKTKWHNGQITYTEYQDGVNAIDNSVNFADNSGVIQGIIDSAYKNFTFDFNNQIGIGSDFDEMWGETEETKKVKDGWEKLIAKYENKLALITNERNLIEAEIDRMEAQGGQASKEMYDDLIRSQLEEKALLEAKKTELEKYLEIHKDSIDPETWTAYNNEINETAVAIKECTTNIIDFAKALHDIDMHYFEQSVNEISRLGEEIEFVMSLFEDDDMFDEDGNWTEAGITKINLMRDLITTYAATAKMWQDRLTDLESMEIGENGLYKFDEDTKNAIAEDFKSMLDSGQISQETYDEYMKQLEEAYAAGGFSKELWTEWHNEAEDGLRDAVSAGKDAQGQLIKLNDTRIDAIEDGIQKEIEAYEDYISVVKDALSAERDLYDFKKNVQKQSKDIASLERRIAALSGSTNAADVAERRKLEAELIEAKEGLNDTYYDHSRDAQSNALDDEAEAFSKAKEKYIETLREWSKDGSAVLNDMFLNGIFNSDVANEFLLGIEEKYEIPLSDKLKTPWATAAETAAGLKESVGVPVDNTVTMISDSIIAKLGTDDENNPWNNALNIAGKYSDFLTSSEFNLDSKDLTTFEGQVANIVKGWNSIQQAANDAYAAQTRQVTVGGTENTGNNTSKIETPKKETEKNTKPEMYKAGSSGPNDYVDKTVVINGKDGRTYYGIKGRKGWYVQNGSFYSKTGWINEGSYTYKIKQYAKGTMGTSNDEWAITDEIGDELTMYATPQGTLSYMRAGSTVVPADITSNLVEWGKLNPNMMKVGGGANINMINNAVVKPELSFEFDSLVHVDHCDEGTLKDLETMVDNKIKQFSKQMNYAIKKIGGR